MDVNTVNEKLALGEIDTPRIFPHLDRLKTNPVVFKVDFGLPALPMEPGILMIRGPRQYGKSTWLEQQLYETIREFGPGTAFYLNGDELTDAAHLEKVMDDVIVGFAKVAPVKRLFIDEITTVSKWEVALKRMADRGQLKDILVITTGSKATDLRRGGEKLPGRKGKLSRTTYLFTPISYREFHRVCGNRLKSKTFLTYLLSGGSPIACSELVTTGVIPEYVIELVRDWIEGEIAFAGRSRVALANILNVMFRLGGSPVGQAKLAREAGLSNNTVAVGYVETLSDLGCVMPGYAWDQHKKILLLRKPCKYHFINTLAVVAYHPGKLRAVDDFLLLPKQEQGRWFEWLVAQELQRRAALQGENLLAPLAFWQNQNHEIDFVMAPDQFIEVKRGRCNPLEFAWFKKQFPGKQLTVINQVPFATDCIHGITFENFML